MFGDQTIGTCSICGGAVTSPMVWMSVSPPPPPRCSQCGATAAAHGPVIPMVPARRFEPLSDPWMLNPLVDTTSAEITINGGERKDD